MANKRPPMTSVSRACPRRTWRAGWPCDGLRGERVLLERRGRVDRAVLGVVSHPVRTGTKGFWAVRDSSSSSASRLGGGGSGEAAWAPTSWDPDRRARRARSSLSPSQSLCARCSSLAGDLLSSERGEREGLDVDLRHERPTRAAVPRNLTIISSISAGSKSPAMLTSRGPDFSQRLHRGDDTVEGELGELLPGWGPSVACRQTRRGSPCRG